MPGGPGSTRSIGYTDNNNVVQYLKVMKSDDEVNAEEAAGIVLLDRIATALESLVEIARNKRDRL